MTDDNYDLDNGENTMAPPVITTIMIARVHDYDDTIRYEHTDDTNLTLSSIPVA